LAISIFCRKIDVNTKKYYSHKGPLLIASNHPNSFLDAIIFCILFNRPVYSLARGDVFKNKWIGKILFHLNILPVYRISEGAENLNVNYDTFAKCREIFKKNGIVLIFSEGLCINEWKLRALKKGTARLAFSSWDEDIDVTVLPAGINYQSFSSFGKNIQLNFGNPITKNNFLTSTTDGKNINGFNEILKTELQSLVVEKDRKDLTGIRNHFEINQHAAKKIILHLPAITGKWIHAPLYLPVKKLALKYFGHNDHYDSVMVGALLLTYPIYLTIIACIFYSLTASWFWLTTFIILPFLAWSFVQIKKQF
jgi:1-acyl-sn-glycerol-3-phosphate acyltransferase